MDDTDYPFLRNDFFETVLSLLDEIIMALGGNIEEPAE
jgi:hypothetical protein